MASFRIAQKTISVIGPAPKPAPMPKLTTQAKQSGHLLVLGARAGDASAQQVVADAVDGARAGVPVATSTANILTAAQKAQVRQLFVDKWVHAIGV